MTTVFILALILFILVGLGAWEYRRHLRNILGIPIRIHVNGTRGKSSVTRLIAAGLRAGGIVTSAKTTGTLARMIFPDGSEFPIYRPGRANVIEQTRVFANAVAVGSKAIVIECMALQPLLQWISEYRLVQATIGVCTNARPDHLDVMGPEEKDVALALAGMTPLNGKMFLGRSRQAEIFEAAALDRGSEFSQITDEETESLTNEEMSGFPYVEHRENVALALRICNEVGVARDIALQGMWAAKPDPGAMTEHEINFFGRKVYFVNAFAANDPESTEYLWNIAVEKYPWAQKKLALFNCRSDRQDRSRQLGEAVAHWKGIDRMVLMGTGTFIFARSAAAQGVSALGISFAEGADVTEIFEVLMDQVEESALIVGMGNVAGHGLDMARFFKNRSLIAK